MKKIICVFLTIFLCLSTLSACAKTSIQNNTTNLTTTNIETTAETTTVDEQATNEKETSDRTAAQFLGYIKGKDIKSIVSLICLDSIWDDTTNRTTEEAKKLKAYSIFRDFDVDSYKITETVPFDNYMHYEVELNISKSSNDIFPVGKSRWILEVAYETVILFKNVNKTIIKTRDSSNAVNLCLDFTSAFNCFKTLRDFNKLVPDKKDKGVYSGFCSNLIALTIYDFQNKPIKRKQAESNAKNTFGITTVDFTMQENYNKQNDTIIVDSWGWLWFYDALSLDNFDSKTKQHTIVINYYADSACILIAKTVKYIVKENGDSTLTLLSTELLYDSGLTIAGGAP